MRFTLTYEGRLPPKQRGISPVKRELREHFAPQLEEQVKRFFPTWPSWPSPGLAGLHRHPVGNVAYDTLVSAHMHTAAELDILLLSPSVLVRPETSTIVSKPSLMA